jgi:ankyrin repeat protein
MKKNNIRVLAHFCCLLLFSISIINGQLCSASGKGLEEAIKGNDLKSLKEIITDPKNPGKTVFITNFEYYLKRASRFGSARLLNFVLSKAPANDIKNVINDSLVISIDNDHFHEVFPVLLKAGAKPNHEYDFKTALCRVTYLYADDQQNKSKVLDTLKLLLDNGAYVNSFGEDGKTPLMHACQSDNLPMAKLLMEYGANPHMQNKNAQTAFDFVKEGSSLKNILMRKTSRNTSYSGFDFDEDTRQMKLMELSQAVSMGDAESVKQLLAEGLDANYSLSSSGITMLMQAKNAEIVRILLKAGAKANKYDTDGRNALHHLATHKADPIMVSMLLRAGAKLNSKDKYGETPLKAAGILFTEKIAPEWGKSLLTLLVNAGADINSADNQGYTLLHQAAANDNAALAETCLLLGAKPDIKTSAGISAIELGKQLNAKAFLTTMEKFGQK